MSQKDLITKSKKRYFSIQSVPFTQNKNITRAPEMCGGDIFPSEKAIKTKTDVGNDTIK